MAATTTVATTTTTAGTNAATRAAAVERAALSVTPSTARELLRNELIIGAGITLLGGAIGFGYGLWRNSRAKKTGSAAVESDLLAAFEGAILGIIIALASVIAYRSFFHGQTLYQQARLQQQEALGRVQSARLQRYAAVSTAAPAINTAGLQSAGRLGVGPAANPAVAARLAA